MQTSTQFERDHQFYPLNVLKARNSHSCSILLFITHREIFVDNPRADLKSTKISTVEEEHAIQMNLFVYTRFHSRNIFQVIAKKQVSKCSRKHF